MQVGSGLGGTNCEKWTIYATQEELMDNLYSDAFVSDEENKVQN